MGAIDSGPGGSFAPVAITAAFVVFNRFFDLVGQLMRGVGRFSLEAGLQLGGAVAFIAGATAVMAAGGGVAAVMAVFALKELALCVLGYAAIRTDLRRARDRPGRSDWRALLRIGIRLSLAGIALALAMRVPLGVLGNTGTATEVALFSAAGRFGDGAYVLAITAGFALLPGIAYLSRAEPARARRLLGRVLVAVTAASGCAGRPGRRFRRAPHARHLRRGLRVRRRRAAHRGGRAARLRGRRGLLVRARGLRRRGARLLGVGAASLALCVGLFADDHPGRRRRGSAWASTGAMYGTAALCLGALARQLRARRGAEA